MARIGLSGDIHSCVRPDRDFRFVLSGPRFYSEAISDLTACVDTMNTDGNIDAVFELGDIIEGTTEGTGQTLLQTIEAVYDNFSGSRYHVLGNWDMADTGFQAGGAADFFKHIVNGSRDPETIIDLGDATVYEDANGDNKATHYYAVQISDGIIGIVLDSHWSLNTDLFLIGNYAATSGQGLGATQRNWLTAYLAAHTTETIVVFIHRWLWPDMLGVNSGYYNAGDASDVITILENAGNVKAVFQSHHHPGSQAWWQDCTTYVFHSPTCSFPVTHNGIKYYCLRCPICGWGDNPSGSTADKTGEATDWGELVPANVYYIAEITSDDIKITGYGTNPGGNTMGIWAEKVDRPNDIERIDAKNSGIGVYGGNAICQPKLIMKTMPA